MKNPEHLKLAYLMIDSPIPNVYLGGVMVTDGRGLPLEFRYTEPIKPTRIQQILYGQVLNHYIKRDVIQDTLLKSLESKFKCLLIEDELLLEYPAKGFVMMRVSETKLSPIGEQGIVQNLSPTEFLLQNSTEGSPLRLQFSSVKRVVSAEEENSAEAPNGQALPEPLQLLVEAGSHMDVCEPLKRIANALEAICQEAGINP